MSLKRIIVYIDSVIGKQVVDSLQTKTDKGFLIYPSYTIIECEINHEQSYF